MLTNELFKKALHFVLHSEGGYVNNPSDSGGATNKGITQGVYDGYRKGLKQPIQIVKNITDTEVANIYYNNYWVKAGCDKMSDVFAVLSFDTAVNMGTGRVQEFLKAAEYKDVNKYVIARMKKYVQFAGVPSQLQFLRGWLNRMFALVDFIGTL